MRHRSENPRSEQRRSGKDDRNTSVAPNEQYDDTVADSFPASDPPPSPSIVGPPRRPERPPSEER